MSKIPQGSTRELAPEGVHNAVCVQVIDLGTQEVRDFKDKNKINKVRKVQLAFQLVEEETSEGNAVVVYRQYTFTNSPKSNLMKDLKAWLAVKDAEFEMDNCLGKPVSVTIEHAETEKGTFANVTNLAGVAKGVKVKKASEPLRSLYLEEFDEEVFNELPEYLRLKIADTDEYAAATAPKAKAKPAVKVKGKK